MVVLNLKQILTLLNTCICFQIWKQCLVMLPNCNFLKKKKILHFAWIHYLWRWTFSSLYTCLLQTSWLVPWYCQTFLNSNLSGAQPRTLTHIPPQSALQSYICTSLTGRGVFLSKKNIFLINNHSVAWHSMTYWSCLWAYLLFELYLEYLSFTLKRMPVRQLTWNLLFIYV